MALLAWTLCLNVFSSGAYNRPAQISLNCKHYSLTKDAPPGESGVAFVTLSQEGKRLETLLPEGWTQDFTTFSPSAPKTLPPCSVSAPHAVLTVCRCAAPEAPPAVRSISWKSRSLSICATGGNRRRPISSLALKPQIIAALNEAGLTGAARDAEKMKKGDAAELAEDKMRDNRWVPVWMRAPDAENDVSDTENGSADADSHHTLPDAA